ncbi:MAG: hypothetical protein H7Y17_02815, partial [Chlorobia bacterium]|nr:hypothetical protein [Fimbriimonadaceae bacterium]
MSELNEFIVSIVGVFLGSMILGYAAIKLMRRRKPPVPKLNAVLRISSAGTMYRAHFIGERP